MNDTIQQKLKGLPKQPGCYLMKDVHGNVIYVGKAKNLNSRVRSYFNKGHDGKTQRLVSNIENFEYIITNSEKDSLILEYNLIKKYQPEYNIVFKDDKSYPYIVLTKEKAPILKITRQINKKKGYYFGPFPNANAAFQTMQLLNRIYPLRKCKILPKKVCLYYHLGQCLAPCVFDIDSTIYDEMIVNIKKFLNGDTKEVIDELTNKMNEYSENLQFELAKENRDLITSIHHVTSKVEVQLEKMIDKDAFNYYYKQGYLCIQLFIIRQGKLIERQFELLPVYGDVEETFVSFVYQYYQKNIVPQEIVVPLNIDFEYLKEIYGSKWIQPQKGKNNQLLNTIYKNAKDYYHQQMAIMQKKRINNQVVFQQLNRILKSQITTIDVVDNSHLNGSDNVSGVIVYENNQLKKKAYRKYILDKYQSDLHSMNEVLYRRYYRQLMNQEKICDLLIVDGGKEQVKVARKIKEELQLSFNIIGLVKDEHHRTSKLLLEDLSIYPLEVSSSLFLFLTMLQDEVHRFVLSFHQKRRIAKISNSFLDSIDGIGEKRKKKLLSSFGSVKKIKMAEIEELAKVVGEKIAEKIREKSNEETEN